MGTYAARESARINFQNLKDTVKKIQFEWKRNLIIQQSKDKIIL